MHPKKIATSTKTFHPRQFWDWGASDISWVGRENIIPIYPVLEVAKGPLTKRCMVFTLENLDIFQKLTDL